MLESRGFYLWLRRYERSDNSCPINLNNTKEAEKLFHEDPGRDNEYLPIPGLPSFTSAAQRLILGRQSSAIEQNRVRKSPTTYEFISLTQLNDHRYALFRRSRVRGLSTSAVLF